MTDSPLERYLDELFLEIRTTAPRDARSLLSETESHLHDAVQDATRAGASRTDAEIDAVRRFGDPRLVAMGDRHRGTGNLVKGAVVSAWMLGSIGAVAVGASGLIAGLMRLAGASNQFVAGDRSTAHLTPADCTRWLGIRPHAGTCARAALGDWATDTVWYRLAFGLLGLIGLGMVLLARRRWPRTRGWAPLPPTVVDTIATTLFGVAGVWLAGLGIDAMIVSHAHGAGQWLSAAPIALAASLVFGIRLLRDLTPTVGGRRPGVLRALL